MRPGLVGVRLVCARERHAPMALQRQLVTVAVFVLGRCRLGEVTTAGRAAGLPPHTQGQHPALLGLVPFHFGDRRDEHAVLVGVEGGRFPTAETLLADAEPFSGLYPASELVVVFEPA